MEHDLCDLYKASPHESVSEVLKTYNSRPEILQILEITTSKDEEHSKKNLRSKKPILENDDFLIIDQNCNTEALVFKQDKNTPEKSKAISQKKVVLNSSNEHYRLKFNTNWTDPNHEFKEGMRPTKIRKPSLT